MEREREISYIIEPQIFEEKKLVSLYSLTSLVDRLLFLLLESDYPVEK